VTTLVVYGPIHAIVLTIFVNNHWPSFLNGLAFKLIKVFVWCIDNHRRAPRAVKDNLAQSRSYEAVKLLRLIDSHNQACVALRDWSQQRTQSGWFLTNPSLPPILDLPSRETLETWLDEGPATAKRHGAKARERWENLMTDSNGHPACLRPPAPARRRPRAQKSSKSRRLRCGCFAALCRDPFSQLGRALAALPPETPWPSWRRLRPIGAASNSARRPFGSECSRFEGHVALNCGHSRALPA